MTVSTGLSPLSTGKMTLVPVNLNDFDQRAEFKQQRVVCGWDYSDESLQRFIEKQQKKLKSLFWITLPGNADDKKVNGEEPPVIREANGHASSSHIRAGHISLDSYADPPDPELAREDRSILTVQTFFILPEYRSGGLGRAAMDLLEVLATQEPYGSPRCHTLALTTVSKKHILIDAPEWRGIWKKFGMEVPKVNNELWYEKLGYVYWKEEPRYENSVAHDGSKVQIIASFMRKRLQ